MSENVTKLPELSVLKAMATTSGIRMDEADPWFRLPSYLPCTPFDEEKSSACFLCGAPSGYLCANGCAEAEGWGI